MEYVLDFKGGLYNLPKYTLTVKDEIDNINAKIEKENVQSMDKFKAMYNFVRKSVGVENANEIFGTDDVKEMDLNDINICYLGICVAYDNPVNEYKKEYNALSRINDEDKEFLKDIMKNAGNIQSLASTVKNANVRSVR